MAPVCLLQAYQEVSQNIILPLFAKLQILYYNYVQTASNSADWEAGKLASRVLAEKSTFSELAIYS